MATVALEQFNGRYRIVYSTELPGLHADFQEVHEAVIELANGTFEGKDELGRAWTGRFALTPDGDDDGVVHLTIDPRTTQAGLAAWNRDGVPQRDPVDHRVGIKLGTVSNGYMAKSEFQVGDVRVNMMIYPLNASP